MGQRAFDSRYENRGCIILQKARKNHQGGGSNNDTPQNNPCDKPETTISASHNYLLAPFIGHKICFISTSGNFENFNGAFVCPAA
jgi:hypothetical protein